MEPLPALLSIGSPNAEYLLGDPMLLREDSNSSVGSRALNPHKGSLKEAVKLREGEARSLLLL